MYGNLQYGTIQYAGKRKIFFHLLPLGDFAIQGNGDTLIALTDAMNYNYTHSIEQASVKRRSRGGALFEYKFGESFDSFTIELTNITSDNATAINTWWIEQRDVFFTENSSKTPINSAFIGKITNNTLPLKSYMDMQFGGSLFKGTIILKTN